MAIMQRCCFSNVRSGSIVCGIYSLITSCIYLAVWSFFLDKVDSLLHSIGITKPYGPFVVIYAAFSIDIIVAAFLLIASIVLVVGVSQDNKTMLIPYMVAIAALILLQAIAWISLFAIWGRVISQISGKWQVIPIMIPVSWLLLTPLNITCLICVISQYQELRDGRGRASDVYTRAA